MPRITADTVAEHVTRQRDAVIDAAVRLFLEQGYAEVTMSDIAAEVGLARNSLYRYAPDKAHLLVEWYRQEIPAQIEVWQTILDADDDPVDRIQRWTLTHLAYAQEPRHGLIAPLLETLPSFEEDVRAEVTALHRQLLGLLDDTVSEAGVPDEDVDGVVALLANLVLGAARAEEASGPSDALRQRLSAAVAAILAS